MAFCISTTGTVNFLNQLKLSSSFSLALSNNLCASKFISASGHHWVAFTGGGKRSSEFNVQVISDDCLWPQSSAFRRLQIKINILLSKQQFPVCLQKTNVNVYSSPLFKKKFNIVFQISIHVLVFTSALQPTTFEYLLLNVIRSIQVVPIWQICA